MSSPLRNALFIAGKDISYSLRDRGTLVWLFIMPVLFFYFIGNATGGFASRNSDAPDKIAMQVPASAGDLAAQLRLRLEDAGFEVIEFDPEARIEGDEDTPGFDDECRQLSLPEQMTAQVAAGNPVTLQYASCRDRLGGDFDQIRVQRAVYTLIADVIAANAEHGELSAGGLAQINAMPRNLSLEVSMAGQRRVPPSGFEQAVPGTMVMFTMMILLTSGATALLIERRRGLLRRLASAPISRGEIIFGKWLGKMALAVVQIAFAMAIGKWLFEVAWQPDFAMIAVLLLAWAGLCTSCALLLGSIGRSEGQVIGIGILLSMLLGGLGGCWWPIEVAPPWMQAIATVLPSGWTMFGLHDLMSFGAGAQAALGPVLALLLLTLVLAFVAARKFRYQ